MPESLSRFLEREAATLDSCASEALHRSGAIQPHGALVVIEIRSGRIVGLSENAPHLLGIEASETCLGDLLDRHFPVIASELEVVFPRQDGEHVTVAEVYPSKDQSFDVVFHTLNGLGYIEFIPTPADSDRLIRDKMRKAQLACARIMRAETFQEAADLCVGAIRDLTGFAKTMVYEFMPDWSGHVIAESRRDDVPAYLGLFFPAHDIPKQARYLYSIMPSRSVAAADDIVSRVEVLEEAADLDLTYAFLRSVSPMHTAYFRNMGMASSFSVGMHHHETLWGLVVSHHDEPGYLPLDIQRLAEDIANALMVRLQQQEVVDRADRIEKLRHIETAVAANLRETHDVASTLRRYLPELRDFMNADGFAIEYRGEIFSDGAVPPNEFISKLISQTSKEADFGHFVDAALPKTMPEAMAHRETACGVLVQPVKLQRTCLLIWFRGPMQQLATWAGDPNEKPVAEREDGTHVLAPRNSFQHWSDTHLHIALPWTRAQIDSAKSLFQEILDLIAYQAVTLQELRSANDQLASFTHSTVHDIRGPLRAIELALTELRSEKPPINNNDAEFRRVISRAAEVSVERLGSLVDQVLRFIEIGQSPMESVWLSCAAIVDDIEQLLSVQIRDTGATIERDGLGSVYGNRSLLTTALQNLIQNALTYAHPDRTPSITVSQTSDGDWTLLTVSDNGIGIDAVYSERIFEPFKRLHRRDEISGTGIGLSAVRRIVELHGGAVTLDTAHEGVGARFVIRLPIGSTGGP